MVFKFFQRRFIQVSMVVLITLTLIGGFWGIGQAAAVDLINSYSILKNQYPGYVDRIVAGGANETQIEAFLTDLDSEVSSRGTLNEANFNSVMYQSLQEVLTMHTDVFNAMLSSFPEEIAYTIKNGKLHSNLIPLRNAVMETVLSQKTPPGGVGPGGGPLSGDTDDKVMSEVADQITSGKSAINLSLSNNNSISLNKATIDKINESGKKLNITGNGITLTIPAGAISIANDETLSLSAQKLSQAAAAEPLKKLSPNYKLLGSVYELSGTTEASISIKFNQAVSVTLDYSGLNLNGVVEDNLDVYYYKEDKGQWTAMNGTLDKNNKTITFTTSHFSKYAIIEKLSQPIKPEIDEQEALMIAQRFTDLNGHWAAAEIGRAVKMGIASGISSTQFAPDRNITRAEFAALLTRAIGLPNATVMQSRFTDVTTDAWYFNAVNTAAEAGLVSGLTPSTFAPDKPITREQMAVMISRALTYKGKQVTTSASILASFTDQGQISSWAKEGASIVVQLGIVSGRNANSFAPLHNATRAEATAMILRTYNQL
jgi:hypothetical protein